MNLLRWVVRGVPAGVLLVALAGGFAHSQAAPADGRLAAHVDERPAVPLAQAGGPAADLPSVPIVSAGGQVRLKVQTGKQQSAYVTLQSGLTQGCQRLEGVQPPTLDCVVFAGQPFQQNLTASAYQDQIGTIPLPVQIDVTPALPGATFYKVDAQGNETSSPCQDTGKVSGRFRYTPGQGQVTPSQAPIQIDYFASTSDGSATTQVRTYLRVLPASQPVTIVGYNYLDRNTNGRLDGGEQGLAGGYVNLTGPNSYSQQSQCNGNGRYEFQLPQPGGTYQVAAQPIQGYQPTSPTTVPVDCNLGPAAAPIQVNFGYAPTGGQGGLPQPYVQTDRGCVQGGQNPGYLIGDRGAINFGVNGVPEADIVLSNLLPDGRMATLVARRRIPGGQTYSIQTQAGEPAGAKRLRLETYLTTNYGSSPDAVAECSYQVTAPYPPDLDLSPPSLDFGQQCAVNQDNYRTVTLRNVGQSNLQVYSVGVQGGNSSPYALGSSYQGPPPPIAPGSVYSLDVNLRPQAEGSYNDFLVIRTNDPDEAVTTVPLYGQTSGTQQGLRAQIRTDKGCLERFESPIYFVGEPIDLYLRIDAPANMTQALARIDDVLGNGSSRTIYNSWVGTNQTMRLGGSKVSPPVGNETVRLTAQGQQSISTSECTFQVAASATRIVGYKFADLNGNGIWEGNPQTPNVPGNEPPIPGWRITLTGPESQSALTDSAGRFEFAVSSAGTYIISEEQRNGWRPTITQAYQATLRIFPGETVGTALFGNLDTITGGSGFPTPTPVIPTPAFPTPPGPPTVGPPGPTPTNDGGFPTPSGPPTPAGPPTPPGATCQVQISPRTNLMNVGERAQFAATMRSGGAASGYQWTVDGDVLKDYSEATSRWWSVTAMQPADYRAQSLAFYWKPLDNQRYPQNAGPQSRRVTVTAQTARGASCTDEVLVNVERNNTSLTRQAEDFYITNHTQYVLREHSWWHGTYPFDRVNYDGSLFFDFHQQFLSRFNSWRSEFGYPPLQSWDPATSIPRGAEIDHSGRNTRYTQQPKPLWFTAQGSWSGRPWNRMPCDYTFGGQRTLRDFPSDRFLLGCAVTESWHNGVHFAVGGDMLNLQTAPRDPVFWRWHTFVNAIQQERQGMAFADQVANLTKLALGDGLGSSWLTPSTRGAPATSTHVSAAPEQGPKNPPQVIYQQPFRLYRFITALPSFTVQFNEPVIGVTADDLTVDGQSAGSVKAEGEGEGAYYVFTGFPAPANGPVTVKLAPGGIKNIGNTEFSGAEWHYTILDPVPDDDRDGLTNGDEMNTWLTNPLKRDTDSDGLTDGDEVNTYHTDPVQKDTDLDGAGDKCEVEQGTDPLDPAQVARGCPAYFLFLCRLDNGQPGEQ